ncbi:hypothetical protein BaRGS_00037933 [Batillaria attramentaria]|uniref:Uncharacterized protein n=1 Tax=Batillaria attramentaria TaxID=370345 RepID=A0ABD0J7A7_9CAEN
MAAVASVPRLQRKEGPLIRNADDTHGVWFLWTGNFPPVFSEGSAREEHRRLVKGALSEAAPDFMSELYPFHFWMLVGAWVAKYHATTSWSKDLFRKPAGFYWRVMSPVVASMPL